MIARDSELPTAHAQPAPAPTQPLNASKPSATPADALRGTPTSVYTILSYSTPYRPTKNERQRRRRQRIQPHSAREKHGRAVAVAVTVTVAITVMGIMTGRPTDRPTHEGVLEVRDVLPQRRKRHPILQRGCGPLQAYDVVLHVRGLYEVRLERGQRGLPYAVKGEGLRDAGRANEAEA